MVPEAEFALEVLPMGQIGSEDICRILQVVSDVNDKCVGVREVPAIAQSSLPKADWGDTDAGFEIQGAQKV